MRRQSDNLFCRQCIIFIFFILLNIDLNSLGILFLSAQIQVIDWVCLQSNRLLFLYWWWVWYWFWFFSLENTPYTFICGIGEVYCDNDDNKVQINWRWIYSVWAKNKQNHQYKKQDFRKSKGYSTNDFLSKIDPP